MYGLAMQSLWEGRINVATDQLMGMLCGPTYVPNQNTHKFKSVITSEISDSGYTPGGQQVTGAAASFVAAAGSNPGTLTISGSPLVWPEVTWTAARFLVLYMQPIGAAPNLCPLVAYVDFGMSEAPADEAFYVEWPSTGILQFKLPL
jgi:hypothetical protein